MTPIADLPSLAVSDAGEVESLDVFPICTDNPVDADEKKPNVALRDPSHFANREPDHSSPSLPLDRTNGVDEVPALEARQAHARVSIRDPKRLADVASPW